MNIKEANLIAEDYKEKNSCADFGTGIIERDDYWYFPIGYIGSSGIIINKSDERIFIMGSAHSIEEMFWGHENGFSPKKIDLEIIEVSNSIKVSGLLAGVLRQLGKAPSSPMRRGREMASEMLGSLPLKFEGINLWLSIPWFMEAEKEQWLKYKVYESNEA